MPGNWTVADVGKPDARPGVYTRFLAALNLNIYGGERGNVAIVSPVSWGETGEAFFFENISDYVERYTDFVLSTGRVGSVRAMDPFLAVQNAFIGGARNVLFCGVAGSNPGTASKIIGAAGNTNPLPPNVTVTALHPGVVGDQLQIVVSTSTGNPVTLELWYNPTDDSDTPVNTIIKKKLESWTTRTDHNQATEGTVADLIELITTGDTKSEYITMTRTGDDNVANNTFATHSSGSVSAQLDGGLDASGTLAWEDAINALSPEPFTHLFCNVKSASWGELPSSVDEQREEGKKIVWVTGSTGTTTPSSTGLNNEGIVYVHPGIKMLDDRYDRLPVGNVARNVRRRTRTEEARRINLDGNAAAARIAGLLANLPIIESATRQEIPGDVSDLTVRITNATIRQLLAAGVMPLVYDGRGFRIERGINTLTDIPDGKNEQFKKVKVIAILDAIQTAIETSLDDQVIGKILNDKEGRRTVVSAIRTFFNNLVTARWINDDFVVRIDPLNPPIADRFFVEYAVRPIDSIEFVYNTAQVNI